MKHFNTTKKVICTSLLLLSASICQAQYIGGVETVITGVSAYGSGTVTGDVRISVQDTVAGCEAGYYVSSDNSGKPSILSIALSAFHTGSKVKVHGYDFPRWEGSSKNYCLIEGINLVK